MNSQITIRLPQTLYQQLSDAAMVAKRPIDEIVVRSIENGMPPSVTQIPERFRDDVQGFHQLDDVLLWRIGEVDLSEEQQERYAELLENVEALTEREQTELDELRESADSLMFQRTFAYLLLRWRGHQIPNLSA